MPDSSDDSGLAPVSWPSASTYASDTRAVDPSPRDTRRGPLIRRSVALIMVALLVPTGWSYVRALAAPWD
jgi:hypothetical protein